MSDDVALASRHHRFGWWSLFVFAASGLVLESLHGFRTPWLLDADVETRRVMFRLAHAHGALLALVNLALAATLRTGLVPVQSLPHPRRLSSLLLFASTAIPAGFLLGGMWFFGSDPGLGIALVPAGAIALLVVLSSIARRA